MGSVARTISIPLVYLNPSLQAVRQPEVFRSWDTRKPQIYSHAASWTAFDNPFTQILRQGRQNKVKCLRASDIGLHEPRKAA